MEQQKRMLKEKGFSSTKKSPLAKRHQILGKGKPLQWQWLILSRGVCAGRDTHDGLHRRQFLAKDVTVTVNQAVFEILHVPKHRLALTTPYCQHIT